MSIWEKSGNLGHVHFCVHLNDFFSKRCVFDQKSHCFDYVPSQTCQQFETMCFMSKNRTVSITYQARHVSNSKRCVFRSKSPCFDYVPSQTCHQFETVCFWSKNTLFGYISFHSEGDVRVCTSTSLYSNICRGCISQVRAAS